MMKPSVQKDKKALERYRKLVRQIQEQTEIDVFETPEEQQARIKRLLGNYEAFVEYYFPHYASSKCASFHIRLANMVKRDPDIALLLGWARGLAKSTHCDILIPLWLWCNGMIRVMLLIGHTEDKAKKLLGDLQAEFEGNQKLIHDFGNQLGSGNWQEGNFITANDCAFFALGMGQSPRGIRYKQHRPDYIICDDLDTKQICKNPKRVKEYADWICEDLIPCVGKKGCRFINVNNVFAKHTILTELRDTREGFKYWQQDATDAEFNPYWKENYTKEFYLELAKKIGMLSFQSEYNNKPYVEGTIFKNEMIQWTEIPHLNHFDHILSWWDVAYSDSKTADFNAIKVWGLKGDKFYLIKAFVRQCKMYDAIKWMFDYNDSLPSTVHINFYFESQFWNDALKMVYDQVAKEKGYGIPLIKADRSRTNKFDRIVSMLPFYEQSRVYYNIKEKANNDVQIGIAQLLAIEEKSKEHDDSPDADQAAIEKLSKHIQLTTFEPRFGGRTHNNLW